MNEKNIMNKNFNIKPEIIKAQANQPAKDTPEQLTKHEILPYRLVITLNFNNKGRVYISGPVDEEKYNKLNVIEIRETLMKSNPGLNVSVANGDSFQKLEKLEIKVVGEVDKLELSKINAQLKNLLRPTKEK